MQLVKQTIFTVFSPLFCTDDTQQKSTVIVPHLSKSGILSSGGVTATKKPSYFYIHVLNMLFLTESGVIVASFHSTEKAPRT